MTERSVSHATFVVERRYPAQPARVFGAWTDAAAKVIWMDDPDYASDDIVPGHRIVYCYELHTAGDRMSVSLVTVQIEADQAGTRLTYTEQGAFLDGIEKPEAREEGPAWMLDNLGKYLAAHAGR